MLRANLFGETKLQEKPKNEISSFVTFASNKSFLHPGGKYLSKLISFGFRIVLFEIHLFD